MPEGIIRFKFFKKNELKYLSHLDILTMLSRAFARAGIKCVYSCGFNPKPRVSLSNPIPLGVESLAEYCDIELAENMDAKEFLKIVNKQLPENLKITDSINADPKTPSLMSEIGLVLYDFQVTSIACQDMKKITPESYSSFEKSFEETLAGGIKPGPGFKEGDFSINTGPIHSVEFIFSKTSTGGSILLKIYGYAKIFKNKNNSIFKFNEFSGKLKEILREYGLKIISAQKTEVFIIIDSGLVNPLEILKFKKRD